MIVALAPSSSKQAHLHQLTYPPAIAWFTRCSYKIPDSGLCNHAVRTLASPSFLLLSLSSSAASSMPQPAVSISTSGPSSSPAAATPCAHATPSPDCILSGTFISNRLCLSMQHTQFRWQLR